MFDIIKYAVLDYFYRYLRVLFNVVCMCMYIYEQHGKFVESIYVAAMHLSLFMSQSCNFFAKLRIFEGNNAHSVAILHTRSLQVDLFSRENMFPEPIDRDSRFPVHSQRSSSPIPDKLNIAFRTTVHFCDRVPASISWKSRCRELARARAERRRLRTENIVSDKKERRRYTLRRKYSPLHVGVEMQMESLD